MPSLADAVWPDVPQAPLVLVPVGSIEQHGPHLPLDTDTVIAEAVCRRLAEELPDAWVAPALPYGSSGEHQDFPGTSSIGTEGLQLILVELVRSMLTWAGSVVFVNGHGGNTSALTRAVGQLRHEGHDVRWYACATGEVDLHAGVTETSLLLHLRPESVRLDRAAPGNCAPVADLLPTLVTEGVRAASENGVLGDPTRAHAETGRRVLEEMTGRIMAKLHPGRAA